MSDGPSYDPQAGRLERRASLHPPPTNRLNVPGALNTIDEQLDILHKTISEFENHLQLVLGSPTPSSAEVAKAHDSPQIVDRMMRQNDAINGARIRLTSLMERLQL